MRLDAIAHYRPDHRKSLGIDVTVWHPGAESARNIEAAASAPHAAHFITRKAEVSKQAKYSGLCAARGIKLLPAAYNTYGGCGEALLHDLILPYFAARRAEERAKVGREWGALQEQEVLYQRFSVAIAQGNTMVLDSLTQGWERSRVPAAVDVGQDEDTDTAWDGDPAMLRDFLGGMP